MNISVSSDNRVYTLTISGRIDTLTAPGLEEKFSELEPNADKVIFDMKDVEYVSSAGIRAIVAAHRAMAKKDGLMLRNLNKNVMTIIELTGFTKVLDIE